MSCGTPRPRPSPLRPSPILAQVVDLPMSRRWGPDGNTGKCAERASHGAMWRMT